MPHDLSNRKLIYIDYNPDTHEINEMQAGNLTRIYDLHINLTTLYLLILPLPLSTRSAPSLMLRLQSGRDASDMSVPHIA